ncbi:MAG TPA: respiratory nitrate reductase subunit gamma [Candidatus Paceibacterota bacterium]|nr:respiratory nitrate reductase subunit gamma [Verrucomicrobiota bacterium]HRY47502.1 respiratory nitrate reductase subunit gamma [Candidatus Paceibacterota bacterium]
MIDAFLFIGLPYIAIIVAVLGSVWRMRHNRYSLSARSSQFLEDRQLLWGSAPWHIGILGVLLGHLVAGLLPQVWASLMTVRGALLAVETIGVACSLLAIVGLGLLIYRRVTSARMQAVTTVLDLVLVALLLAQISVGLMSALSFRYGAAWSTGTVVPYFWGLITLNPDMAYVVDFPMLFKLHLTGAWLIILLLPFTRLMHVLAVPVHYLWRAPQLVLWNNARRRQQALSATIRAESRREFLKGAAGVAGAGGLLALGVSEKTLNFFKGPLPDSEAESAFLEKKLQRLQQTAEERKLVLERQRNEMILISRYADLSENKGQYFIDYTMAPGLAFKGKDGMPIVLSAKCTHLGCTVGSETNANGQILCPCHISYFNIVTGEPNPGAPAKTPLPQIGWALVDASGKVVASRKPGQPVQGQVEPALLPQCNLYITKPGRDTA